jgi:hypothetical protein
MNVIPVVGLGNDSDQIRIGTLGSVKATQEQVFQTLGPGNPLVGLGEYRNTLTDMLSLSPYRNINRYFKQLPPNVDQMMAQQAAQAQQAQQQAKNAPNPAAQAQAQAIMARTQAQIQGGQAKQQAETQRNQQKIAMEQWVAQQQLQLERMKAEADVQLQQLKAMQDMRVDMAQLQNETALEHYRIAHQIGQPDARIPNPDVKQ